jgi:uncharacterized LabA/DUF88 family protein
MIALCATKSSRGGCQYNHAVAELTRVYAFLDGGYVRQRLEELGVDWTEISLRSVALSSLDFIGGGWGAAMTLSRAFLYDAVSDDVDELTDRVAKWLARNNREMDLHVKRGRLRGASGDRLRQKGVDVQLAVDALSFATSGVLDVVMLVAGDADFAPLAEAVRNKGPLVAVCAFRRGLSPLLADAADRVGYLPNDAGSWESWKLPPTA